LGSFAIKEIKEIVLLGWEMFHSFSRCHLVYKIWILEEGKGDSGTNEILRWVRCKQRGMGCRGGKFRGDHRYLVITPCCVR
jgi:hypothetical protein